MQPTLASLGPQWNVARSTHHRIAWLARESSKPGRGPIERWTVQASPAWSQRHLEDDAERVKAKLLKAFTEVTGIRAEPPYAAVHRWRYAQTSKPLGKTHAVGCRPRASAPAATGAWATGSRTALSRAWKWRWPFFDESPAWVRRPYRGPVCTLAHRPAACGLAGRGAGQLARCPGAQGQWLVRIEDVDTPRCLPGAGPAILQQLAACGLLPDEPPVCQSQRGALYQQALDRLVAAAGPIPAAARGRTLPARWPPRDRPGSGTASWSIPAPAARA